MKKEDKVPRDKNGRPHGYCEWYVGYVQLYYKAYYIHGDRHGLCEIYNDNEKLCYKGYYHMGKELFKTSKNKFIL